MPTAIYDPTQSSTDESSTEQVPPPPVLNTTLGSQQPSTNQQGPSVFDPTVDRIIDMVRPYVGNVAGVGAQLGATVLPGGATPVGQFAAGTQGYAAVDSLLQYLKQNKPKSFGEAVTNAEKDALINEVGGRIFGAMFKSGGKVVGNTMSKLFPTLSQQLEHYGISSLANISRFIENTGAPGSKIEARAVSGNAAKEEALQFANWMNGKAPDDISNLDPQLAYNQIKKTLEDGLTPGAGKGFQTNQHYASQKLLNAMEDESPLDKLDSMLTNKNEVTDFLNYADQHATGKNLRGDLQAYAWSRMFEKAETPVPGKGKILDPAVLNDVWQKDSNQPAINALFEKSPVVKKQLDQFVKDVISTQTGQPTHTILGRLTPVAGGVVLDGIDKMLGGHIPPGTLSTGVFITNGVLGKLLTNQNLVQKLAERAGVISNEARSRLIFDTLQGSNAAIVGPAMKRLWGTITKSDGDGHDFEPR